MSRPGDADAALAAVLEVAFHVARLAGDAEPPFEPPAALRPILRFTNLPTTALRTLRRVLDTDDEFRARVAAVVERDPSSAAVVGEAGMLFVRRPEGWERRLAAITGSSVPEEPAAAERPVDRGLARRLEGAEKAVSRANDELARARERITSLTRSAADDRRRRDEAESAREDARRALDDVLVDRARLDDELRAAHVRIAELEAEAESLAVALDAAQSEIARLGAVHDAVASARAAVDEVRAAIDGLGRASLVGDVAASGPTSSRGATPSRLERVRASAAAAGPQRRPVPLPPGVMADEPDAARHLLRVPGMLVLVDGYNVAHTRWDEDRPSVLREQLLALLSGAAARAKANVHVVFDGLGGSTLHTSPRAGLRVTFTDEGVEADDVLLGIVASLPLEQKVLVVSSDRRVVDGARALGANVVSSRQLLDAWA